LRNQTTNQIKQLKRRFKEQLAENVRDNPNSFWFYVAQKCRSRRTVPDVMHNRQPVADPELKVEIFSQQSASVFSSTSSIVFHPPPMNDVQHNIESILINNSIVIKEPMSVSAGPDFIHPCILHEY